MNKGKNDLWIDSTMKVNNPRRFNGENLGREANWAKKNVRGLKCSEANVNTAVKDLLRVIFETNSK